MARASSPRPCTSQASGRSVGSTRIETLPTSSRSRRSLTRRAVTLAPLTRPAMGLVLMPIVIEIAGSSTVMSGSGRGSSASARVSPMVISGMPATAMMSPGPARSAGRRSRASVMRSSVILTRSTEPSRRHHATCWPLRIVPLCTRSSARRPRKFEASRLVTWACSGASSVERGCGDRLDDGAEQRLEVLAVGQPAVGGTGQRGPAGLGRGVDDGELELVLVGVDVVEEVHEELVDLVDDLADAGVGPVHLVDARG